MGGNSLSGGKGLGKSQALGFLLDPCPVFFAWEGNCFLLVEERGQARGNPTLLL